MNKTKTTSGLYRLVVMALFAIVLVLALLLSFWFFGSSLTSAQSIGAELAVQSANPDSGITVTTGGSVTYQDQTPFPIAEPEDINITLEPDATSPVGDSFTGWSGCNDFSGPGGITCEVLVFEGTSAWVTTSYGAPPPPPASHGLSLKVEGNGSVSGTDGFSCSGDGNVCEQEFSELEGEVNLSASAPSGWEFTGWSGDGSCSGTGSCSFSASSFDVYSRTSIIATFEEETVPESSEIDANITLPASGAYAGYEPDTEYPVDVRIDILEPDPNPEELYQYFIEWQYDGTPDFQIINFDDRYPQVCCTSDLSHTFSSDPWLYSAGTWEILASVQFCDEDGNCSPMREDVVLEFKISDISMEGPSGPTSVSLGDSVTFSDNFWVQGGDSANYEIGVYNNPDGTGTPIASESGSLPPEDGASRSANFSFSSPEFSEGTYYVCSSGTVTNAAGPFTRDGGLYCTQVDVVSDSDPVISITPSSRSYGNVCTGSSRDETFTVTNTGGGTLSGSASVSGPFSCVSGCSYSLGAGNSQTVTIRFSPTSAGSVSRTVTFTGGGGATAGVSGTGESCSSGSSVAGPVWTFTVAAPPENTLTVNINGEGSVVSTPSGINCPGTCSADFPEEDVSLFANPATDWEFGSWTDHDCDFVNGDECINIFMDSNKGATANFTETPNLERVDLDTNPDPAEIMEGESVTLRATVSGVNMGTLTYNFDCGNGQASGAIETTSTNYDYICTYNDPGDFTARVTVTSSDAPGMVEDEVGVSADIDIFKFIRRFFLER